MQLHAAHTFESLSDGPMESRPPTLDSLCSSWTIDLIGYEEATGDYAALVDHCRDMAKGLTDRTAGFTSAAEVDDERDDSDAMAIARQGGERVYDQEQGFAPLTVEPEVVGVPNEDAWRAARLLYSPEKHGSPRRTKVRELAYRLAKNARPVVFSSPLPDMALEPAFVARPNADAFAAAYASSSSPVTDLDVPELVQSRRHWRDIGPEEQREREGLLDAEQPTSEDPDGLVWIMSQLMREGGITPTHGFDGVTVEDLEEALGEQGAANYLAHLYSMAEHQRDVLERERKHAREFVRRHPTPYFARIRWETNEEGELRPVGVLRGEARYGRVTRPWRERNAARKAAFAARAWDGQVNYDPRTAFAVDEHPRQQVAYEPPRKAEPMRGRPRDVLAFIERWLRDAPEPVPARPGKYERITCPSHPKWWMQHGNRIYALLDEWPLLDEADTWDPVDWYQRFDDGYYVLKYS